MLAYFFADARNVIKSRANRDETGATAVEYGIMVALIAVVIIVAVTLLGGNLEKMMGDASCALNTVAGDTYNVDTNACAVPATP